jgi:hypothetical protein
MQSKHIGSLNVIWTHVVELAYVESNSRSQSRSVEGSNVMQPIKKCQKVAPNANFTFFGSKILYKKQDEVQKLFLDDLMLLTTKGLSSLNTCDNIWMHRLALKLDPKLIFLF